MHSEDLELGRRFLMDGKKKSIDVNICCCEINLKVYDFLLERYAISGEA